MDVLWGQFYDGAIATTLPQRWRNLGVLKPDRTRPTAVSLNMTALPDLLVHARTLAHLARITSRPSCAPDDPRPADAGGTGRSVSAHGDRRVQHNPQPRRVRARYRTAGPCSFTVSHRPGRRQPGQRDQTPMSGDQRIWRAGRGPRRSRLRCRTPSPSAPRSSRCSRSPARCRRPARPCSQRRARRPRSRRAASCRRSPAPTAAWRPPRPARSAPAPAGSCTPVGRPRGARVQALFGRPPVRTTRAVG
jgi:hypothetical protein